MKIFRRIAIGWDLAVSSWKVIWDNKILMLFPLLSGISFMLALAMLVTGGMILGFNEELMRFAHQYQAVASIVATFVMYMVLITIVVFFNVALISCASRALSGQKADPMKGLADAFSRIHLILIWAAISSTVAVFFNMLERHRLLGRILRFFLGTLWSVLTYLVIPVMVFEGVNPFQAIGRSKDLIFKTWGESITGSIGTGIMTFVLLLPIIPLCLIALMMQMPLLLIVAPVWFVLVVLWSATAGTVLRVAVYAYAANVPLRTDYYDNLGAVFYGGDLAAGAMSSRGSRVDSRIRTASGDTELHKAVDDGNLPVIKIMVERGANIHARGADGKTPMERAMAQGRIDIAQFFYDEIEKAKENPFENQ